MFLSFCNVKNITEAHVIRHVPPSVSFAAKGTKFIIYAININHIERPFKIFSCCEF